MVAATPSDRISQPGVYAGTSATQSPNPVPIFAAGGMGVLASRNDLEAAGWADRAANHANLSLARRVESLARSQEEVSSAQTTHQPAIKLHYLGVQTPGQAPFVEGPEVNKAPGYAEVSAIASRISLNLGQIRREEIAAEAAN
jgi:hypothetical protein